MSADVGLAYAFFFFRSVNSSLHKAISAIFNGVLVAKCHQLHSPQEANL